MSKFLNTSPRDREQQWLAQLEDSGENPILAPLPLAATLGGWRFLAH